MLLEPDLSDMALEIKATSINSSRLRNVDRDPLGQDALERSFGGLNLSEGNYSATSVKAGMQEGSQDLLDEESSYVLATESHMDDNVDQWIMGATSAEAAVQSSNLQERRVTLGRRSAMVATSSFNMTQVWCLLALLLPIFNSDANRVWRCTPSMVFNSAEYFLNQISNLVNRARIRLARLARQQVARDCFATAMDLILVVYAFGFLILSMYQAAIIG